MKAVKCACCGGSMKRNGKTSSGAQRWRCAACGASATVRYDDAGRPPRGVPVVVAVEGHAARDAGRRPDFQAQDLGVLGGLAHARARRGAPPRPFRRRDLARGAPGRADLLQRRARRLVVHGGIRELRRAWSALMEPIPAPDVVVTDGGSGFAKAVRATWPRTKVQRCVFHAFCQVKRCTTTRPKLQAGRELYGIALDLMHIETLHQAELWRERYLDWCGFWADFLEDTTLVDGRRVYTHERLRKARRSLSSLVSAGTLFTYLDPGLDQGRPAPFDQQ